MPPKRRSEAAGLTLNLAHQNWIERRRVTMAPTIIARTPTITLASPEAPLTYRMEWLIDFKIARPVHVDLAHHDAG